MSNGISEIDLGIIIFYVMILLGVGYYVYRRNPTFEEYLLAGRSMTTPILICTLASAAGGASRVTSANRIRRKPTARWK